MVNTINHTNESEANVIEKSLKERLKIDLKLYLEQVKVQPGGLKEEIMKATALTIAPPKPPQEIIESSRESILTTVRQSTTKIENITSPSTVVDFYVGFHDKIYEVSIILKIKRDQQFLDFLDT